MTQETVQQPQWIGRKNGALTSVLCTAEKLGRTTAFASISRSCEPVPETVIPSVNAPKFRKIAQRQGKVVFLAA